MNDTPTIAWSQIYDMSHIVDDPDYERIVEALNQIKASDAGKTVSHTIDDIDHARWR